MRDFVERAVDPTTGYRPSRGLIGNIVNDVGFKVTPQLISALAAGLGIRRDVGERRPRVEQPEARAQLRAGEPPPLVQPHPDRSARRRLDRRLRFAQISS